MPYRLKGILKLPNSAQVAAGVDIEFISRRNYSPLLMDLSSIIKTSPTGAYDITLEYGEYAVVLYWGCNQPSHIGKLFVFADTVEGLDLQTLLQQADWQPATPEYVQQIQGWLAEGLANATKAEQSAAKAKDSEVVSKLEADRSKIEADKAAQAVIDSSVPFPDVWIPFNDSLRMLAGYGRDVKAGADTVATMASFERTTTATYIDKSGVLRAAAINEPRFEKEGLLIEGQSTNLFLNSEIGASQSIATQADKYTISFYGAGSVSITGAATLSLSGTGANDRVSKTFDCSAGNLAIAITGQVTKAQLEKFPFASSYIPTGSAAVTRTADKCHIQWEGNAPQDMSKISFSIQFTMLGLLPTGQFQRVIWLEEGQQGPYFGARVINSELLAISSNSGSSGAFRSRVSTGYHQLSFSSGGTAALDGINASFSVSTVPFIIKKIIRIGSHVESGQQLFGHVRNLRVWHSALSAAQIKGLK